MFIPWILDKLGYVSKQQRDQDVEDAKSEAALAIEPLLTATVYSDGHNNADHVFTVPFYREGDLHSFIRLVEHGWKGAGLIKANVSYRCHKGGDSCRKGDQWILPKFDRDFDHRAAYFEKYFEDLE